MATSLDEVKKLHITKYPGRTRVDAGRLAFMENQEEHMLPESFSLTVTNANAAVKTACILNNSLDLDYSGYAALQATTTGGGLTYSTSYKAGYVALRRLLVLDNYVVSGFVIDCGSDANADAGQFDVAIFEGLKMVGQTPKIITLADQLIGSVDKSSFNKRTRAINYQFECNSTNDLLMDIIPSGKVIFTFVHVGKNGDKVRR